jgi:hypothetical protein
MPAVREVKEGLEGGRQFPFGLGKICTTRVVQRTGGEDIIINRVKHNTVAKGRYELLQHQCNNPISAIHDKGV